MNKIYEKVMGLFRGIGIDKYLHFIAGIIISAFFAIVLTMPVCIVPTIVAAFAKELFDGFRYGVFDWWDFTATVLGGAVIQVFALL